MAERLPAVVRTLCAECGARVHHAAKSHKHYTHLFSSPACSQRKIVSIKMQTVQWRS